MGRKKLPEQSQVGPASPELSARRQASIAFAQAAQQARPLPPTVAIEQTGEASSAVSSPHSNAAGWGDEIKEAFGTASPDFSARLLGQLDDISRHIGAPVASAPRMNFALAAMAGIAPADEHQAMIAAQIIGAHELAMDCMSRARQSTDALRDTYITQATKCSRTMAALTDSLVRLRTGGRQTHEVVYVDARGSQNAFSVGPRGEGGKRRQPHVASLAPAPGAAMWGENEGGHLLPPAGDARQEAVSETRREEPRGAAGKGEWTLSARPEDEGVGGGAPAGQDPRQRSARCHR